MLRGAAHQSGSAADCGAAYRSGSGADRGAVHQRGSGADRGATHRRGRSVGGCGSERSVYVIAGVSGLCDRRN